MVLSVYSFNHDQDMEILGSACANINGNTVNGYRTIISSYFTTDNSRYRGSIDVDAGLINIDISGCYYKVYQSYWLMIIGQDL